MEVLVIRKFFVVLITSILFFGIFVTFAKANRTENRIESITPQRHSIIVVDLMKNNLCGEGINKNSTIITEPELKDEETYYSDTIRVLVTEEIRNRIDEKLLKFEKEIKMLAQVVYNEARGVQGTHHKAAVMWCVLNRVDSENGFDNSIAEVLSFPNAFAWWSNTPVEDQFVVLAEDVLTRWLLEKEGFDNVGRVLPSDYYFFHGANGYNHFRKNYSSKEYWDWSLESPYPD